MNKKVIIIVIVCFVLILVIGGISYFIYSVKKDQKEVLANINKINDYYEEFSDKSFSIDEIRLNYSKLISDVYYETLDEKNDEILDILDSYTSEIEKIKLISSELSSLCGVSYVDVNINNKCNKYKSSYDSILKYYELDVSGYNGLVKKYNEEDSEIKLNEYLK